MWWEKNNFLPAAFWPEIILINHHYHPWNREMHLIHPVFKSESWQQFIEKMGPKSLNSGLVQIIFLQKWWFDIEHISISTRMFDGHCCYRTLFLYLRTQLLHNYSRFIRFIQYHQKCESVVDQNLPSGKINIMHRPWK